MAKYKLYWVSTDYATFSLMANTSGKIVQAAPIANWTIGKSAYGVTQYYANKKNATIAVTDIDTSKELDENGDWVYIHNGSLE